MVCSPHTPIGKVDFRLWRNRQNKSGEVMKFGKIIHPVVLDQMKHMATCELSIHGEMRKGPVLIVANHACVEDIPTLGQAVKNYFYLLVSDEDKYTLNGLAMSLHGVYWVSRLKKKSRARAGTKAVEILKSGENFAMYPEATWNLSPNSLMLPMNYGCIRIALEAGSPIVPVVSFWGETQRHASIGEPFYPTEDLTASIDQLRDAMATMMFDHICREGKLTRRIDLTPGYWQTHIDSLYDAYARCRKNKSATRRYESQFIFQPKGDAHQFFLTFNSITRVGANGKRQCRRISSERNGYDDEDFSEFFGFGYNEGLSE